MIVIFIEFACVGLIMPIIPGVINAAFGSNVFLVSGISQGAKGILAFFSAPVFGALSDVWGRKLFLFLSVLFTCLPIPLLFLSSLWPYVLVLTLSGLFAVTFSIVFAYATDITTEAERSVAYGKISAMFAASLVISPVVGSIFSELYGNEIVYQLACLLAIGDLVYIYMYVPESLSLEKQQHNERMFHRRSDVLLSNRPEDSELSRHSADNPAGDALALSLSAPSALAAATSGQATAGGDMTGGGGSALRPSHRLPTSIKVQSRATVFLSMLKKGDPFQSLKTIFRSKTLLKLSVMVFLSYLPEAGEQLLMLQYLGARFGFTVPSLALFIAIMGLLSIFSQTLLLSYCNRRFGDLKTIRLGLFLGVVQLLWYGVASKTWMAYGAGAVAALSTLSYPAISALVSKHAPPDHQGAVQGIVTGVRMLCNGLGPLLFGLLFDIAGLRIAGHENEDFDGDSDNHSSGLPFLFGSVLVMISLALTFHLHLPAIPASAPLSNKPATRGDLDVDGGQDEGPDAHRKHPSIVTLPAPLLASSNNANGVSLGASSSSSSSSSLGGAVASFSMNVGSSAGKGKYTLLPSSDPEHEYAKSTSGHEDASSFHLPSSISLFSKKKATHKQS